MGLGLPEIFALGAASGTPAAFIIALATGCDGQRTATVESPPDVSSGMRSLFGIIMVRGPGQNLSARRRASSGMLLTSGVTSDISVT